VEKKIEKHIPLRRIALRIHETDVMIDVADSLQLVGVAVVVRAPFGSDLYSVSSASCSHLQRAARSIRTHQKDRNMRPPQPQEIQLKLIHIRRLAIQQQQ